MSWLNVGQEEIYLSGIDAEQDLFFNSFLCAAHLVATVTLLDRVHS